MNSEERLTKLLTDLFRIHSKLTVNLKPANDVAPSFVRPGILYIDQFELFIRNVKARLIFIPVCLTENLKSCFCACRTDKADNGLHIYQRLPLPVFCDVGTYFPGIMTI